jgi:hypothetical protein
MNECGEEEGPGLGVARGDGVELLFSEHCAERVLRRSKGGQKEGCRGV